MVQPRLDWTRDVSLPVSGRTVEARHASATGAMAERERRGAFALTYRKLLIEAGPMSDHEAARITGRAVSTLNSTRNGWGDRVVPSGQFESVTFQDGRSTKRVKWMLDKR